ncbi:ANTAR domain-containing protein [Amycolatopsis sp. NPDC051106]|uniref:ANTAR domain-containing protein n=1 Tax=unclassified Amycolatopsis TaxID=2618356 RepID=UPI003426ED72
MSSTALLDMIGARPAFQASRAPYLVLDLDLRIHAANAAYAAATLTTEADLSGTYLFDAFPDNPNDPRADGTANLSASLEQVLRTGRRHHMGTQRYDVPDIDHRGRFVRKVWSPLNVPLRDAEGLLVGVLHHVEDITDLDGLLAAGTGGVPDVDAADQAHQADLAENRNLRLALRTRGVIEQAKGILIGQRGCTPDEAFALLVALSQDTNTKLHLVARTLVDDTLRRADNT